MIYFFLKTSFFLIISLISFHSAYTQFVPLSDQWKLIFGKIARPIKLVPLEQINSLKQEQVQEKLTEAEIAARDLTNYIAESPLSDAQYKVFFTASRLITRIYRDVTPTQ